MIAIASGLLGNLETATATVAKKDVGSSGFAAAFQQVSAKDAGQAQGVAVARARRVAGGNGKAGELAGGVIRGGSGGASGAKVLPGDTGAKSPSAALKGAGQAPVVSGAAALPVAAGAPGSTKGLTGGSEGTLVAGEVPLAGAEALASADGDGSAAVVTLGLTPGQALAGGAENGVLLAATVLRGVSSGTVQSLVVEPAEVGATIAVEDSGRTEVHPTTIAATETAGGLAGNGGGAVAGTPISLPDGSELFAAGRTASVAAAGIAVGSDVSSKTPVFAGLVARGSIDAVSGVVAFAGASGVVSAFSGSVRVPVAPPGSIPASALAVSGAPTSGASVGVAPITSGPAAAAPSASIGDPLGVGGAGSGDPGGAAALGAGVDGGGAFEGLHAQPVAVAASFVAAAPLVATTVPPVPGQTVHAGRSPVASSASKVKGDGGGLQTGAGTAELQGSVATVQGSPVEANGGPAAVVPVVAQAAVDSVSVVAVAGTSVTQATELVDGRGGRVEGQQAGSRASGGAVPVRPGSKRDEADVMRSVTGATGTQAQAARLVAGGPQSSMPVDAGAPLSVTTATVASIADTGLRAGPTVQPTPVQSAPVATAAVEPTAAQPAPFQRASAVAGDFAVTLAAAPPLASSVSLNGSLAASVPVTAKTSPSVSAAQTPGSTAVRPDGTGVATVASVSAAPTSDGFRAARPGSLTAANGPSSGVAVPGSADTGDVAVLQSGGGEADNDEGSVGSIATAGSVPAAIAQAGRGLAVGASAGRERKTGDAEEKAATSRSGEMIQGAVTPAAQHVATTVQEAAKPVAVANQAPVESGTQSLATGSAGLGGGIGAVPLSAIQATTQATTHVAVAPPTFAAAADAAAADEGSAPGSSIGTGLPRHSSAGLAGNESLVSPLTHTTLQATPTVLEVGVPGGTHGWLKIRAEIGEGGTVQASMSAATREGQESLRRELPAMNAFLDSEHVPVSVQVAAHGGSAGASSVLGGDAGPGLGSNVGSGLAQDGGSGQRDAGAGLLAGGDGSRQGSGGGSPDNSRAMAEGTSAGARGAVSAESDWVRSNDADSASGYGSGILANGGSWLNVMA